MMRRLLRYFLCSLAAFVLLAAAVYGSGLLLSRRKNVEADSLPGVASWIPEAKLSLGTDGKAELQFELPLWCRIVRHSVTPGTGLVQSGAVRFHSRWRWNKRIWLVTVPFRAYRTGTIPPGALELLFSALESGGKPTGFRAVIPDCTVSASGVPQGKELMLAGEVSPAPRRLSPHWLWLLLLLPAVYVAGRLLHRAKVLPPAPPWILAKQALEALRLSIRSGETLPAAGFIQLTDLVRNYLEIRFRIPASTRTTPEFLASMEDGMDGASVLPEEYRPFLREFLSSADLVKFAKADPDRAILDNAITRAEELVERTGEPDRQNKEEQDV